MHHYSNNKPVCPAPAGWKHLVLDFLAANQTAPPVYPQLPMWAKGQVRIKLAWEGESMHHLLMRNRDVPTLFLSKTRVPVHLRLVSSLLEALRSLQSKFSSQNSANHTFLRLFSRVSPVKYSSNPANGGKRRMAQFRTNYQPIKTWRKWSKTLCSSLEVEAEAAALAARCWKHTSKHYFIKFWPWWFLFLSTPMDL